MDVPNVRRTEFQLLDIPDGFLSLMDGDGNSKDDVKLPETDIGKEIETNFEEGKDLMVTIISAMGEEQAISWVSVVWRECEAALTVFRRRLPRRRLNLRMHVPRCI